MNNKTYINLMKEDNLQILYEMLSELSPFPNSISVHLVGQNGKTIMNYLLHRACKFSNLQMVIDLLKMGAEVNNIDKHGRTPLHNTIIYVPSVLIKKIVLVLLKYGADVNVRDNNERLLLHDCIDKRYRSVIKKLWRHGLDLDEPIDEDGDQSTPQCYTEVKYGHQCKMTSLIRKYTKIQENNPNVCYL